MTLKLKVAPKNVYWTEAHIICPQDYDETVTSSFKIQWERFSYSESKQFHEEQVAISQHAARGLVERMADRASVEAKTKAQEGAQVLQALEDQAGSDLPEDFDPGADFALRWLKRKVRAFDGLLTEDDQQVTVEDLPELVQIISYRVGLMHLLREQMNDPNAAERKN